MPKLSKRKPYTAADMREVSDNPAWTKEDFAKARPFSEVFPDLATDQATRQAEGADQKAVSVRLDADVLDALQGRPANDGNRASTAIWRKAMKLG